MPDAIDFEQKNREEARWRMLRVVDAGRGEFREPGLAAFAFELEQAQVAQVGELAPHGVERQRQLDVGEHAPDYLLGDRYRPARVDDAQHAPARFLAILLFEINSVRHKASS